MHRECKYARIVLKNKGGAVALMHIEIDNQGGTDEGLGLEDFESDRQIVKDTKPRPIARKRMVSAASGIASDAVLQGQLRRQNSAANCCTGSSDQPLTPRQANPPLSLVI